jgi:hypothetical protein
MVRSDFAFQLPEKKKSWPGSLMSVSVVLKTLVVSCHNSVGLWPINCLR